MEDQGRYNTLANDTMAATWLTSAPQRLEI